ncbi:hypothetical protein ACIQFZ_37070 [Streptomyces sp. NPDC093064]|uniref:hypothetical protein n=1 Tax=Streptomyces sp. NPDC093064 TaxID=3366020 RepID=UPI0038215069
MKVTGRETGQRVHGEGRRAISSAGTFRWMSGGEPEWADLLTPADRRGLTPLFWSHVRPYGEVKLNMTSRLPLSTS